MRQVSTINNPLFFLTQNDFSALMFDYRIFISKLRTQLGFQYSYNIENKNMNKDHSEEVCFQPGSDV